MQENIIKNEKMLEGGTSMHREYVRFEDASKSEEYA